MFLPHKPTPSAMVARYAARPLNPEMSSSANCTFEPPSSQDLLGDWFIVQTSLPFWSDKRNVKITYSEGSSAASGITSVQDDVIYQTSTSEKTKTVRGLNTSSQRGLPGAWDWRGLGWVKIVSNHWEVLAHDLDGLDGRVWMVIHTEKSFFAPEAVHVYSRIKTTLSSDLREGLQKDLMGRQGIANLLRNMYDVRQN